MQATHDQCDNDQEQLGPLDAPHGCVGFSTDGMISCCLLIVYVKMNGLRLKWGITLDSDPFLVPNQHTHILGYQHDQPSAEMDAIPRCR